MNQEPIKQIIAQVQNSALTFANKSEALRKLKQNQQKLELEEIQLKDLKQQETNFANTSDDQLASIQDALSASIQRYLETSSNLRSSILKNAKLSIANDKAPLVLYASSFKGISPKVQFTRYFSYIIKLKAEVLKKLEELYSLRQRVFCTDKNDDLKSFQLHNLDKEHYNYLTDTFSEEIGNISNVNFFPEFEVIDKISRYISQLSFFSNKSETLDFRNYEVRFPSRISTTDFESQIISIIHQSKFQGIPEEIEHIRSQLNNALFDRQKRLSSLLQFYFNKYSSILDQNYVYSSKTVLEAQTQLFKTQQIINELGKIITPKNTIIWSQESQINSIMVELISSLQQLLEKITRNSIIESIPPIKSPKIEPITIEKDSNVQIERCLSLISSLEMAFNQSNELHSIAIDELKGNLFELEQLNNKKLKNEIDFETPKPFYIDDSKERNKFLEIKKNIINKQNEQLKTLINSMEELPSTIKNTNLIEYEINQQKIVNIIKEDKKDDGQIKPIVLESSKIKTVKDLFSESNQNLIEKIENKTPITLEKKTINITPENKKTKTIEERINDLLDENNKDNNIRNEKIEDLADKRKNLLEKIKEIEKSIEIKKTQNKIKARQNQKIRNRKMIEKEKLSEKLAEVQNKIKQVKSRKNDITNQIKELNRQHDEIQNKMNRYIFLRNTKNKIIQENENLDKQYEK